MSGTSWNPVKFLSGYCLVYFNVINFKRKSNIRYGVAVGDC